ncbi:hypothetical protein A3A09_00245 [Candidatus Nomurabacteria bacterium RIFCSPLOWO2_01_FULL_42_20]|nr:MAG: hypothetical protein A3A09_00245 [Candidatus Nomurabacteria bacterium RIFCSPLOWO2_01_FULL_42_20]
MENIDETKNNKSENIILMERQGLTAHLRNALGPFKSHITMMEMIDKGEVPADKIEDFKKIQKENIKILKENLDNIMEVIVYLEKNNKNI